MAEDVLLLLQISKCSGFLLHVVVYWRLTELLILVVIDGGLISHVCLCIHVQSFICERDTYDI